MQICNADFFSVMLWPGEPLMASCCRCNDLLCEGQRVALFTVSIRRPP